MFEKCCSTVGVFGLRASLVYVYNMESTKRLRRSPFLEIEILRGRPVIRGPTIPAVSRKTAPPFMETKLEL